MPKRLKNTEGMTPRALKIVYTPTYELRHMLKSCQPSDIVSAHLAMRRENLFPTKQRIISDFMEGKARGADIQYIPNVKDKMKSSWYAWFASEWEKTCTMIRGTKGDQQCQDQ